MRQRSSIAVTQELGSGWRQGVADALKHWWLVTRVSGLGAIIGVLPGVGASTADWLAYGHVVQSSRDKSQFGKGDIRGVIAPEAANNAVRGGDLVPTLFFGIPGSGSMALLLGAFVLIGIQPGAKMVGADLDKTFVIIWSLAIANVGGALLCILLAGPIAKLTLVRYAYLAPLITVLMVMTAFQATKSWGDVILLVVLTVVGLWLKRFDWPRPALVVGFVLSHGLEASLYQTAQVYGFSFLQRPQSIFIALLVIASLASGLWMMLKMKDPSGTESDRPVQSRLPALVFTAALLGLAGYALLADDDGSYLTRLFPSWVAIVTIALLAIVFAHQLFASKSSPVLVDFDQTKRSEYEGRPSEYYYLAWFLLFLGAVWALGFPLASLAFVFAFITAECGRPLWKNAVIGGACLIVLILLSSFLYLEFPAGLLPGALSFPRWLH
jgi:hypothetical protein